MGLLLSLNGQAQDPAAPSEISNDHPERALQLPPASSETRAAFDDFERFARRGAWERALAALETIPEDQSRRFVDGRDGFIVTVGRKRLDLLAAMPPDGQAAYRLFHDAEAKKRFEQALRQSEGQVEALEAIVERDLPSAIGDDAADRLGDLYFEAGRFDQAADAWLIVLDKKPDTDLDPARIALKAAIALSRASRGAELAELRSQIQSRYSASRVSLGGRTGSPAELLAGWLDEEMPSPARASRAIPGDVSPTEPFQAAWRFRFADNITAGMTAVEQSQWLTRALSATYPSTATDGHSVFGNYLGRLFAIDLETGKLRWRSASFHPIGLASLRENTRAIDPSRYTIAAADGRVWAITSDVAESPLSSSGISGYRLECRRADDGSPVWRSNDLSDYAGLDFQGSPLLAAGLLFVAASGTRPTPSVDAATRAARVVSRADTMNQGLPRQYVLAIEPRDGRLLWAADLGALRVSRSYYYSSAPQQPRPMIVHRAGALYVETQLGVLARIDAASGRIAWGFAYPTPSDATSLRMIVLSSRAGGEASSVLDSSPVVAEGQLLVKGARSDQIAAIDPDRGVRSWIRPIARSARPLAERDGILYLGGPEVHAMDLSSRKLLWATPLPGRSQNGRLLVTPGALWQLTPRGVFEIDATTGDVRRILRGDDMGAAGGDLLAAGRWLLTVTNRAIAAYPLGPAPSRPTPESPR
jgi:outer membrane protein assembly factor BamB